MTKYIHGYRVKQAQNVPEKKREPEQEKGFPIWIDASKLRPEEDVKVLAVTVTKAGKKGVALVSFSEGEWKGTPATVIYWMPIPEVK